MRALRCGWGGREQEFDNILPGYDGRKTQIVEVVVD